jgi:hypothetical protein
MTHGVSFPADRDNRRSTTRAGRAIVADALRPVDPVGALGAEQETAWRSGYVVHFRRLVEAGVASPDAWLRIADAGLDAVRRTLVVVDDDDTEHPLESLMQAPASRSLDTREVVGEAEPQGRLVVPYRGRDLEGAALRDQLADWMRRGVLEPSAADAVGVVVDHPEWLALDGRTVVALGAGAEMGPVAALLRWGATVAGVDLQREALWGRLERTAKAGAGRLLVPTGPSAPGGSGALGVDLLAEVPAVAEWLTGLEGRLVLGNYLYADGGTHVRVAAAADVLATRLLAERPDTALAFLATPTDAFAVPREAVEHSTRAYRERSGTAKVLGRPLRWASRGRLLHRAYPPMADPGICDSIVPAQGPNYVLAKRIQRWRAAVARRDGHTVSFHVAPSTRTRSVVKNRALAAAFAGAHRFGVEVFDPDTANTLMAALLVHDLNTEPVPHDHPWQDEAHAAVHGGLWRAPYEPRSALGLAAALGYASARS